jgi:outer membrane protein assembly factor BamD
MVTMMLRTEARRTLFLAGLVIGLVLQVLVVAGCGSSKESAVLSVEERFSHAKQLFDDEDYLEAINELTVITLQFPGSARAAEAQYYLAECRFKRGEFLLAVFEYSTLKRSYPASPLVADAQYKIGLSYYELSPVSSLDQQYTRKAIDEFQAFVEYYPSHPMATDADAKIRELTNKLARKEYETAKLYATMQYYASALYYYDEIIEKYHDTDYAPLAYLGKVEVLMEKKRYREAAAQVDRFIQRFPDNVLRGRADQLKKSIERELSNSKASQGKDSGSTARSLQGTDNQS